MNKLESILKFLHRARHRPVGNRHNLSRPPAQAPSRRRLGIVERKRRFDQAHSHEKEFCFTQFSSSDT